MKIEINVSDYEILSTLITGFEGGIRYWCGGVEGYGALARCVTAAPENGAAYRDAHAARFAEWCRDGKIVIFERDAQDSGPGSRCILDATSIARGLVVLCERYPLHFGAIADGHGDAVTGDVLIQCAIFGDIVYG